MKKNLEKGIFALTLMFTLTTILPSCTKSERPIVETISIKAFEPNKATVISVLEDEGDENVVEKGVVWDTQEAPTLTKNLGHTSVGGNEIGQYESSISGLTKQTTYYTRSYATSKAGTSYGKTLTFRTSGIVNGNGVTDIDGNSYPTVIINNYEWMAENLRTTSLNDGTEIKITSNNSDWTYSTLPAGFWYKDNKDLYGDAYGALYTFNTVNTNKLCPTGWRVPSVDEWEEIEYINEIGMGGKLKSVRTAPENHPRWDSPNEEATDEYGLSLTPGGARDLSGNSYNIGVAGFWWTSTGETNGNAYGYWISHSSSRLLSLNYPGGCGFSVRCIKDVE